MRISDWSSDVCSSDLRGNDGSLQFRGQSQYVQLALCGADALADRRAEALAYALDQILGLLECLSCVDQPLKDVLDVTDRSEQRRVGEACARTCRSGWLRYH